MDEQGLAAITEAVRFIFGDEYFVETSGRGLGPVGSAEVDDVGTTRSW